MKTKIFFFDCETTGVDYWRTSIHQLAFLIEIDGVVKEQHVINIRPLDGDQISDEALAIGHVTREQVMAYPSAREAHGKVTDVLAKYVDRYDKKDKFFLCGYNNAAFDNKYLRRLFESCGDRYFGSFFHANPLDVYVIATLRLMQYRASLSNFKLATVARSLGMELFEDKLHDALYDLEITRELYHRLVDDLPLLPQVISQ